MGLWAPAAGPPPAPRGAAATLAATWVLATAVLFVRPRSDRLPERGADAVVVFAGGRGERLAAALDLVARGVAPVLVVSNGTDPAWPEANRLCAPLSPPRAFAVLCPRPDPDTTRGEARATARLVAARGWSSVVLVTSTYHGRRAGVLLRRCLDGDDAVAVVAAAPRQGWVRTWRLAAREWAGLARALVADRRC